MVSKFHETGKEYRKTSNSSGVAVMSHKLWVSHPLHTAIIQILKKGALTDNELFEILKDENKDISFRNLNKTLIKLEIGGKIHVSTLTKGKRRIELIAKKNNS
jgi:hypothetical protein